jgi:hypothetical protein
MASRGRTPSASRSWTGWPRIFGLSPGLDIRYGAEADRDRLRRRFDQLLTLGCRHFSLLFDDTSGRLDGGDADR